MESLGSWRSLERQEKIVQALRAGNYFETACEYAGVSSTTGYDGMQRGEGTHEPAAPEFAEFADAVKSARADTEVGAVARIRKAATEGTWQADAWFLERAFPEWWRRRDGHDIRPQGPIEVKLAFDPRD